jgi:acetoin:2,6-dichlorophenolindophenol oxidoreductase subunit beta
MRTELTFTEAIREAIDHCMSQDDSVFAIGEGVPDPKAIFGTTLGLREKYGPDRILDMPLAENAMTGVCIGSALAGMRPILMHQRADFAFLSMDQIINNAAKWHYMFNGQADTPLVIRMMVGRGWGQGPQHSNSPQALYAHIPGLKVIMPTNPHDAKGMLISAIEDDGPVICIEHRWIHHLKGSVPEEPYREPLEKARVAREGMDVTIAAFSYMTIEAISLADSFKEQGVSIEVIDMRCASPLDHETVIESVRKTGRLVILDTGWMTCGISAELSARVSEKGFKYLKMAPLRIALPDIPTPTSPSLAEKFYPTANIIGQEILKMLSIRNDEKWEQVLLELRGNGPFDVPYIDFRGPF